MNIGMYVCVCMCVYVCVCVCICVLTWSTFLISCTYTRTYTYTYAHTQTQTDVPDSQAIVLHEDKNYYPDATEGTLNLHGYSHTHTHIYIYIYIYIYSHKARTHTHTHTYIHTYIRTHIHTYIHTCNQYTLKQRCSSKMKTHSLWKHRSLLPSKTQSMRMRRRSIRRPLLSLSAFWLFTHTHIYTLIVCVFAPRELISFPSLCLSLPLCLSVSLSLSLSLSLCLSLCLSVCLSLFLSHTRFTGFSPLLWGIPISSETLQSLGTHTHTRTHTHAYIHTYTCAPVDILLTLMFYVM